MADPTGEAGRDALKLDFDRQLMLQFRDSAITSDAGLLPYRELDDALSLTDTGADVLSDTRTGRNSRHRLAGLLRQSVFGRLAGYEDVNDADRLCRDPAMRWVVGNRAITGSAASASQMGRFEVKWLSRPENLAALADLPGRWIDKVHTNEAWSLTNTQAGWLAGIASAGYMLAVIPLVGLTDRRPARQIYLASSVLSALSGDELRQQRRNDRESGQAEDFSGAYDGNNRCRRCSRGGLSQSHGSQ